MGAAAVRFVSAFAVEAVATQWERTFERAVRR
jgi:hypothetical protein